VILGLFLKKKSYLQEIPEWLKERNRVERNQERNFNLVNVNFMINLKYKDFIDSGVHFGHMTKK
jgi:hypothetical protein